ncbi:MAG: cytochrome b/b6 domain-containing protein [Pseudomonadota bacterium]
MPLTNAPDRYGGIAKTFHWLTALLILTVIPLGIIANDIAYAIKDPKVATTEADLARAAWLFSLHKTIGVTIFFVALARILWAFNQTKPGLLNGDKPLEAWAAETVHWLLYGSLVAVPLTGWIHHAATTGFAPIWWPFGQSLPFVPKDEGIAHLFGTLHYILQWVLIGSVTAHILGALKHHVVDGDNTLRRMLPGATSALPSTDQPGHGRAFATALIVWAAAMGGGSAAGWFGHDDTDVVPVVQRTDDGTTQDTTQTQTDDAPTAADLSDNAWLVSDGTLGLSVKQLGSDVAGTFSEWNADIEYDETPDANGKHGSVTVTVTIASLTLGSVTDQAKGADYLDATGHPKATFQADILSGEAGHVADGTLTIKGQSAPVQLPFDLTIEGDTATASGSMTVDRRTFGVGAQDEGSVGASVSITFDLQASKP